MHKHEEDAVVTHGHHAHLGEAGIGGLRCRHKREDMQHNIDLTIIKVGHMLRSDEGYASPREAEHKLRI